MFAKIYPITNLITKYIIEVAFTTDERMCAIYVQDNLEEKAPIEKYFFISKKKITSTNLKNVLNEEIIDIEDDETKIIIKTANNTATILL